jgi:uncharacterized membrane-anchored protein
MNRSKLLILAVALLTVIAQLFIPASMAKRYEDILQTGESYLFKVEPRDPTDPFKGRYVVLTFPISSGQTIDLENPEVISGLSRKTDAYALIAKDSDGFARIRDIMKDVPENQNFIKIKNNYSYKEKYHIKLPFDRYYAEESKAPEIESLLWNRARDENRVFYADVRIKNGYGVIAELYVEGTPILEYLNRDLGSEQ